MDHSIVLPKKLSNQSDFLGLFRLIDTVTENVKSYHQVLKEKDENILFSMDQLSLNEHNNLLMNRDKAVNNRKLEIIKQTLSTLHFMSKYLEKAYNLHKLLLECPMFSKSPDCITLSFFAMNTRAYIGLFESLIRRCLKRCIDQLNSLDSGYKSPFDFSSTIEKLIQSLDNKLPVSTKQVESLLTLVQSELSTIKEINTMNDGQKALITIYCDKLNQLESELSTVNKETENKPKQRCKKLRDIVDESRLIIKETFELVKVLESIQEFNPIDEKEIETLNDLIDHLTKIKKSLYDSSYIIEQLLKSFEKKSSVSTIQIKSLIEIFQRDLMIFKETQTLDDDQRALIAIYCDELNQLESELSSVNEETHNEPEQRNKKLRDIVDGIRSIIKKVLDLVKILEPVDKSEEIFSPIDEKGVDAMDDLIDHMEKIKKEWIEEQCDNETQKVSRLAALKRINVELKKIKKLKSLKTEIGSSWIIIGMKNIFTNFNHVHRSCEEISYRAYYMTHNIFTHKPKIEVPDGFKRDDVIYNELNSTSEYGIFIYLVHLMQSLHQLNSLPWNGFQLNKPRKVCDCFRDHINVTTVAIESCLDEIELHQISFDLADHLVLAKNKIATDRDALEFRLFRYKPEKPFKFEELQKVLKTPNFKTYEKREYMEEHFDEILDGLNRKVVNRGQVIIYKRAVDMMKRSLYTFKQMRWSYICPEDRYLIDLLIDQLTNEFTYAAEIVVKLLDQFRSNRRIPFSFNADGPFTNQIDLIGLKVKDEFEKEVDSLIEKLKLTIKEKEDDLEPIKEEKTQLRYLTSILKRSKLIPINELELSEQDELIILKEIIEEYEYTMLTYGPVA